MKFEAKLVCTLECLKVKTANTLQQTAGVVFSTFMGGAWLYKGSTVLGGSW